VLVRRSEFWDLVAAASAEIAVVLTGLSLVTGMLWGRPTWGVYWVWDARLTSTALLFLMLLGYQAVRALPADRATRARRSAVAALVTSINVPIVHYSVDWWRSLHQSATVSTLDPQIADDMLFAFAVGMVTYLLGYLWLLIHRFRLGWLQDRADDLELAGALVERRAEGGVAVGSI
jgi:heme exporter protein C